MPGFVQLREDDIYCQFTQVHPDFPPVPMNGMILDTSHTFILLLSMHLKSSLSSSGGWWLVGISHFPIY